MSEAETLPALTVKTLSSSDGQERLEVTFGNPPRKIEAVELDLGQQFDLAEVTGGNAGNLQWMNMAYIAASVRSIDGTPVAPGWSKANLRETLKRLGIEGMRAAGLVVNGYRGIREPSEDEHRGAVGN